MESFPPLQPRDKPRGSPVKAVLLTNADLDHTLGLLSLRESDRPQLVYARAEAREHLAWMDSLLRKFSGIEWCEPPEDFEPLTNQLEFRRIDLIDSIAYEFRDKINNKTAVIAPSVPDVTDEMLIAMQGADIILFDGTFWSERELLNFRPNARTSSQMGHVPNERSLPLLRDCRGRRIYMHINNTNPILQDESAERRQVEAAGVEIGADGMEFQT